MKKVINLGRHRPKDTQRYSNNIDTCTVWQFKMVQNKKDLRYLLIDIDYLELPEADTAVLSDAWEEIQKGWSDILGGGRADLALLKQKRIFAMKQIFGYHAKLYESLQILPLPELVKQFNGEGYKVDIRDFENTMKLAYGKLMKKKAQIEMLEPKIEEEEVDFDSVIVALEKAQGYGFNEKEMTVRKLANIYKQLKEDGKRKNKKK